MRPPVHGQRVVLGVRPEHLRPDPQGMHEGTVQLIEPMGNHQVVWMAGSGRSLAAVVDEAMPLRPDQPLRYAMDATRVSLFDRADECRL